MVELSVAEAREHFSEAINRAAYGKERIVVTRGGKPLVAIVPVEDMDLIREIEDRIDREELHKIRAEIEREGTIPWEVLRAELES